MNRSKRRKNQSEIITKLNHILICFWICPKRPNMRKFLPLHPSPSSCSLTFTPYTQKLEGKLTGKNHIRLDYKFGLLTRSLDLFTSYS